MKLVRLSPSAFQLNSTPAAGWRGLCVHMEVMADVFSYALLLVHLSLSGSQGCPAYDLGFIFCTAL